MKITSLFCRAVCIFAVPLTGVADLYQPVQNYIDTSLNQFDQIDDERRKELRRIALYVRTQTGIGNEASLNFICTHNSRRSHMSQLWAQTAADYYGIKGVKTFSGGTEATAFNPRAVAAMIRAGFNIEKTLGGKNPLYHVRNGEDGEAMRAFSKKYEHEENPQDNFCAVMVCSDADKNCPTVKGASYRVAIPYVDPKAFDNTELEAAKYDERCRQISREMLFLFSQVEA